MKLTSKTEYALLAMVYLARNHKKSTVNIHEISEKQEIPHRFLEQILLVLKRAGLVMSKRGKEGGYSLAKDPADISIAEIVRILEGALAPTESVSRYFYSETPLSHEKSLLKVMKDIRDLVSKKLENTTLADIV